MAVADLASHQVVVPYHRVLDWRWELVRIGHQVRSEVPARPLVEDTSAHGSVPDGQMHSFGV